MIAEARNLFVNYMHIEEKNISLSPFIPPVKRFKQISLGTPGCKASASRKKTAAAKFSKGTDFLSLIFVIH